MKPAEASYVCSVLDDCAAVGDTKRLDALRKRCDRHALNALRRAEDFGNLQVTHLPALWIAARDAAFFRQRAITHRLRGEVSLAVSFEEESEKALRLMPLLVGRTK
jgi:hypothetical protein